MTGHSKVKRRRLRAFTEQSGRCYYCKCEMWLQELGGLRVARQRWPALTERELLRRKATSEHLVRKADGGGNGRNIVAACMPCNSTRGELTPGEHMLAIRCDSPT